MKSLFLVALLSAVLGAAYLFTRGGPDTGTEVAGPGGSEVAADGDADVASPTLDVVGADGNGGRDRAASEVGSSSAPSPELGVAASEEGPVHGTVRGRVTDADGVGLPGGNVQAAAPVGLLSRAGRDRAVTAETSRDGSFELSVPAGDHRVAVGVDGYAPTTRSVLAKPGQAVDLGEIRLPRGVRISGRVLNDRGLPVEGASIHRPVEMDGGLIQLGAVGEIAATTDSGGNFEILRQAVGPFEFKVDHVDHIRGSFDGVTTQPGEAAHGIEVTLAQGASIAGVVTGLPAGSSSPTLTAYARLESRAGASSGFGIEGEFGTAGQRTATVGDDGSFRIRGLAPERRYEVWIQASKRLWESGTRRSDRVAAQSGDTGVRVPYRQGATLRLAILDQSGDPVPNPTIRGGFGFQRPFDDSEVDAAAGLHALRHIWPPKDAGPYQLTIEARGFEAFERKDIIVVAHGELDLGTITLRPKPQLEVTVLDASSGEPVEGARVSLEKVADRTSGGAMTFSASISADVDEVSDLGDIDFSMFGKQIQTTDEEGKCTLDVEPGTSVHVDVVHKDFAETRSDPMRIGVGDAVTETEVRMLPGGTIAVLVRDPDGNPMPGARVERRGDDGRPSPAKATTGSDGQAVLAGLAPGVHGLRLAKDRPRGGVIFMAGIPGMNDGADWTEVTVEAGQTAEAVLQAEPPMHVMGTITEAGVALAGAKVSLRADGGMPGLPGFLGGGNSATTDARGQFRLEDVEGGDSVLVVAHGSRAMDYEHKFEVEAGDNEVDLDLGVTIVEGLVRDHEGEPLAGAKVKVGREQSGGSRTMVSFVMATDDGDGAGETFISGSPGEPDPVYTDSEGRYTLRGVQAGVTIAVTATADGYDQAKSETFEMDAGEVRGGVDLEFVLTGSIKIVVEGGAGRTLAILRRRGDSIRDPRMEHFSGEATTIDGLAPGAWTVRLTSMGGGDASFDPEEVEVDVAAGEVSEAAFSRGD